MEQKVFAGENNSMIQQQEQLTILVDAFRKGNERVFTDIYELTQRDLHVYALMLMKDPDKAQDLLQDTYIKAIEQIQTLKDPSRFLPWAKTILHNLAMTEFRKQGKAPILLDEDKEEIFDDIREEEEAFIPGESLDRRELQEIVFDVIKTLPVEQRVTMTAFYYDEMSVRDIAEMMDCSEGTVKTRLFHGRKAFKGRLEAYEKRHNIRLHSAAPLLFMGFQGLDLAAAPTADAAAKTFAGITAKTGIQAAGTHGIAGAAAQHGGSGYAASQYAGAKAAGTRAVVKTAAGASAKKIVAAVAITALVAGGGGLAVHNAVSGQPDQTETKAAYEETEEAAEAMTWQTAYRNFLEQKQETIAEFRVLELGDEYPALVYGEDEQGSNVRKVNIVRYDKIREEIEPLGPLESSSGNGRIFYKEGRLYAAGYLNGQDFSEYLIENGEISARGYSRDAGGTRRITYKGKLRAAEGKDLGVSAENYVDDADGDVIGKLQNDYAKSVLILDRNNKVNREKIK